MYNFHIKNMGEKDNFEERPLSSVRDDKPFAFINALNLFFIELTRLWHVSKLKKKQSLQRRAGERSSSREVADTSKYTIEERLIVSVWVHEKERSGETYEKIRDNFFLRFNKAAPSEVNLRKLEKKTFSTGSVLESFIVVGLYA
ncbi:hypothetical protein C0J52_03164 [Blattella germanica]|nr:hypothetical protein C0J52_03164 [Blattella germanica]